jgi:hypothetical protein
MNEDNDDAEEFPDGDDANEDQNVDVDNNVDAVAHSRTYEDISSFLHAHPRVKYNKFCEHANVTMSQLKSYLKHKLPSGAVKTLIESYYYKLRSDAALKEQLNSESWKIRSKSVKAAPVTDGNLSQHRDENGSNAAITVHEEEIAQLPFSVTTTTTPTTNNMRQSERQRKRQNSQLTKTTLSTPSSSISSSAKKRRADVVDGELTGENTALSPQSSSSMTMSSGLSDNNTITQTYMDSCQTFQNVLSQLQHQNLGIVPVDDVRREFELSMAVFQNPAVADDELAEAESAAYRVAAAIAMRRAYRTQSQPLLDQSDAAARAILAANAAFRSIHQSTFSMTPAAILHSK